MANSPKSVDRDRHAQRPPYRVGVSVSLHSVSPLLMYLTQRGHDVDALLRREGVDPGLPHDPEARLPHASALRLWQAAGELTSDTATTAGRYRRRARNPSPPSAGRSYAPDRLPLPVWSRTNSLGAAIACWSDPQRSLDNFDFNFNKKMNRSLVFNLATGAFIARHEDALFLGPPGTGKSHLAQAIGQAAIQQGYRVLYRETHKLLDDLAEATIDGTRKEHMELLASVPLLIIDDLGMRKLPVTAAEELLEIVMRRYERTSTLLTSNRPVEDWGKLLGDSAAVTAMLDRLLHHGHVLKCGPRSWRTKIDLPAQEVAG